MKKNSKKKKVSSLLLLLLITVVMLGTATFAWFTSNRTVQIDDITVNVATSSGLQISTDAQNWKTVISTDDIVGAAATYTTSKNQLPANLTPVSTAGTTDSNGYMEMFLGDVKANNAGVFELKATKDVEQTGTTGNFIAFDIFLKTEADQTVYLTKNSGVVISENQSDAGLQYASRIGFVEEGNVASSAAVSSMQALKGATKVTIWEPNADGHNGNGINNGKSYYSHITAIKDLVAGTGNATVPYDGVQTEITTGIALEDTNAATNSDKFKAVTTLATPVSRTTSEEIFALKAGVTKIRVYIWVEGQDIDCENNASGHKIDYNISFSLDEEQA